MDAAPRLMLGAALVVTLSGDAGCVRTSQVTTRWDYEPFTTAETTRVLGCAELAFTTERDPRLPGGSLLLDTSVRNHCVRPTPLDLSAMRLVAYDRAGTEIPVSVYDPRQEIHAAEIDSEAAAVERIRVDVGEGCERATRLCIDVGHVSRDAERATPARVCMGMPEGTW